MSGVAELRRHMPMLLLPTDPAQGEEQLEAALRNSLYWLIIIGSVIHPVVCPDTLQANSKLCPIIDEAKV